MRKALLVLAVALLGSLQSVLATEGPNAVVVLMGDSQTVGYNAHFGDRFGNGSTERGCPTIYLTNILQKMPDRNGNQVCATSLYPSPIRDSNKLVRNAVVANWGIGGSSTDSGVARITSNLNQTRGHLNASSYYVLIMYGTNDFAFGLSTTTTKMNTISMIQQARAAGVAPVVGTLIPRDDRDVTPYNNKIRSAALEQNVTVVDHFARFIAQAGGWQSLVPQEISPRTGKLVRLHPSDHGYLVIAESWFDGYLRHNIAPEVGEQAIIAPVIMLLLND